ncbi:hypothetical protein V2J09_000254 [Rumex salicifolius]
MKGEVQLEEVSDTREHRDTDPLLYDEHYVDSSSAGILSTTGDGAVSSEINDHFDNADDDLETGNVPCCRICLECDGEEDDELISPCMCKGTQQFVHRSCLDHWRSVKASHPYQAFNLCNS